MRVSSILSEKGDFVATVSPTDTVTRLCDVLSEHGIGAAVVTDDGTAVAGIASERDVVRAIAREGAQVLAGPVSAIMTEAVAVCEMENNTDDLMLTMTQRRIRHVPVLVDDNLAGIVSIGDVVRVTVAELQEEKATLLGYITS